MKNEGLADAAAANPFRLPRLHPGIRSAWPFALRLSIRHSATVTRCTDMRATAAPRPYEVKLDRLRPAED